MGFLERRRIQKAVQQHRDELDRKAALLGGYTIKMGQPGTAAVEESWSDAMTPDQRDWLRIYAAIGFVAKQAFNLGDAGGREIIRMAPRTVADLPSFAGPGRTPAEYRAEVWQWQADDELPFLQTPAKGRDDILARYASDSVRALLAHVGNSDPAVREQLATATRMLQRFLDHSAYDVSAPEDLGYAWSVLAGMARDGAVPNAFDAGAWLLPAK